MANGETDPAEGGNLPSTKPAFSVSPGRNRRKFRPAQVLALIGVVAGVVGAVAAIIQISPSRKEECGEGAFLAQAAYHKYVEKDSSNQPKAESLYTSSGEPKNAGDVIIESSPELSALAEALRKQQPLAPGQMIFLYGAGGSGKTVVLERLIKSVPHTAIINVGERFRYVPASETVHQKTELRPELTIHGQVISKMPALKDEVFTEGLESLFKAGDVNDNLSEAKNIIVDSLDELYPVSSMRIIEAAMQYVSSHPDKNVLLAGRGETFRAYFEKESYSSKNFKPIHLKPMYVGNEPMLSWFVWQTLRFEHIRNKTPGPLPSKEDASTLVKQLQELWKMYPELRDFMVTLSPANFLISHVKETNDPNQLTRLLYFRTAERNRERHYRPSQTDGVTWRLYNDTLEQIARIAPLRPDGSFLFPVQQTVKVRVGNQCVDVNAANVLNLSELADLEPFNKDHLIYRFFPRPFHKYLAEKQSG